ncbi:hypothetical protein E3G68_005320 [Mycobacteroides abscessus]|uniref:SDR family NAD(P)-dependent oxidoreductase n=1 Tax=Mycobacteroides abscessus TaxID=36809 RepID=UPI00187751D1|nr:hypothetical protein [Mycobacteroides abscessus]
MVNVPRVAIVTGASGCFGGAIARRLAVDAATVLVSYRSNRDAADTVVDAIVAAGGIATSYQADVTRPAEVRGMFDAAEQRYGAVDVVVNAARMHLGANLLDIGLDEFDRLSRTNIRGAFLVSQHASHRVRRGGAIVNLISSTHGPTPAALDTAVRAITEGMAGELAGRDITLNAIVCPPARHANTTATGQPLTEAVAQLAGATRWVTGQVISVQGSAAHPSDEEH